MSAIEDFASGVYEDIGSPSTPTVVSISGWAENNIGLLNIVIDTCYITASGDFYPAMGNQESGIYQEMYKVKHYERQLQYAVSNVAVKGTGSALDWVELRDGDSVVRRANPAEFARIYRGLKSDAQKELNDLVETYRANLGQPQQIVGDEWQNYLPNGSS